MIWNSMKARLIDNKKGHLYFFIPKNHLEDIWMVAYSKVTPNGHRLV